MIAPLSDAQQEFLTVMGLADEFTVEMALFITGNPEAGQILSPVSYTHLYPAASADGYAEQIPYLPGFPDHFNTKFFNSSLFFT